MLRSSSSSSLWLNKTQVYKYFSLPIVQWCFQKLIKPCSKILVLWCCDSVKILHRRSGPYCLIRVPSPHVSWQLSVYKGISLFRLPRFFLVTETEIQLLETFSTHRLWHVTCESTQKIINLIKQCDLNSSAAPTVSHVQSSQFNSILGGYSPILAI